MKIAIIFPKDSEAVFNKKSTKTFGGATIQMYLISKELGKLRNHKVFSFISDYGSLDFDESGKFNLVKTFRENENLFKKIFKFIKKLKLIKPDVIIQHGLSPLSPFLSMYSKANKIKLIFIFASDVESVGKYQNSKNKCLFFKTLLRNASLLITQNVYQKENLLKFYDKSSIIIYPAFEMLNKFPDKKRNTVLWVSRCDKLKNPEVFIQLSKKNPNLDFIMVCPPSNDLNYYSKIKESAKKVKNLTFKEFVSFQHIENYFKEAKIFVNTSDYEGFPNTFLQAIKFGVPILSLNVNPDEFILKYNCGYVCKNDINLLNKNLKKLFKDKYKYNLLSKNAFNYAGEKHNLKKNTKFLLSQVNNLNEK